MPTSTVEDYLKCILLAEDGTQDGLVPMGRIANDLEVAPGTVTAMIKTLAQSGLVAYEPYAGVRLREAGRRLALHVQRRHRLIELFLVRVMGMSWREVHHEAELLEHAVSDRLIERMDELLGYPVADPHGDPIPGADGTVPTRALESLATAPVGVPLRVVRIEDQSPEFLALVEQRGCMPGEVLVALERDGVADALRVQLSTGETLGLGLRAGSKILVELEPEAANAPVGGAHG